MDNKLGVCGTIDYLARLLAFSIRGNTEQIAERLVERFGSIDLMVSAREEELSLIEGMTPGAIALLKIASAVTSRRITDEFVFGRVCTEAEITDYLVGLYLGVTVETVYMLIFDEMGRVTSLEYMGEGTVGASDVYPRKLLEAAIKQRASAVILAHNHPRGHGKPSKEDVCATERLVRLFKNAGIDFLAHYIISERDVGKVVLSEEDR